MKTLGPPPWRPRGECRQSRLVETSPPRGGFPVVVLLKLNGLMIVMVSWLAHVNPLNIDLYIIYTLRIQVCPKKGITPPLHSYSKDGIGTLNPILGRGLDS